MARVKPCTKNSPFCLVALRGVGLQAVGNVVEVGFPIASVSKATGEFALFVTTETEVCIVVRTQQIGIKLFLNHQVRDGQFSFSFVHAVDGEHAEIVEQAHEIIGISDTGGREATLQFAGDEALAHEGLND